MFLFVLYAKSISLKNIKMNFKNDATETVPVETQ